MWVEFLCREMASCRSRMHIWYIRNNSSFFTSRQMQICAYLLNNTATTAMYGRQVFYYNHSKEHLWSFRRSRTIASAIIDYSFRVDALSGRRARPPAGVSPDVDFHTATVTRDII